MASSASRASVVASELAGRRRELSVRMALGAEEWRIGRLIPHYASAIVVCGTVLERGGAYALSRTPQSSSLWPVNGTAQPRDSDGETRHGEQASVAARQQRTEMQRDVDVSAGDEQHQWG
jgi:hypothetical protein